MQAVSTFYRLISPRLFNSLAPSDYQAVTNVTSIVRRKDGTWL